MYFQILNQFIFQIKFELERDILLWLLDEKFRNEKPRDRESRDFSYLVMDLYSQSYLNKVSKTFLARYMKNAQQ